MEDGRTNYAATLNVDDIKRKTKEASQAFENMGTSAQQEGAKIDEAFKLMAKTVASFTAGFFSVKAATDFVKQIINVRSEIQSLEVSFKTLLGDEEKAVKLLADIRKFAANTPMQMNDLAAGAQTLLAFNIEAEKVMPILQALGDISMGDSQKFQSLTLAFSQMSSTGRLLGNDLGQMINAGFNPLAQISEKTGKSIGQLKEEMAAGKISVDMVTEAFMEATGEGGKFYNMLEQQSKGIQGSFSNVQGALQDMMNELGENLQEPVTNALHGLQSLIQNYEKVGKVLAVLVATYGGYKAAVITTSVVENIAYQAHLAEMAGLTKKAALLTVLREKQLLLNKAILKNPYAIVAAAVVSLISAFVLLRKRTDEAKMAQEALNRATEESFERSEDLKNKVEEYKAILDDDTASELAHYHALQQLKALLPEYLKDVKTYNDYLQQRKELLAGMPQAVEDKENGTLKEKITLLEKYLQLQQAGLYQKGESYLEYDRRIEQDFGSYEEYQKQFNEVKSMVQEFYDEVEDENKGNLDQFVNSQIEAYKKVLAERRAEQKKAAEDAIPIRQKIELKKGEIEDIKKKIDNLRKDIESKKVKVTVDDENLSNLIAKLGVLRSELFNLENQQAGTPVKDLKAITKAIETANEALVKAQKKAKEYGLDATSNKEIDDATAELESAKKDYKKITGKDYDQVVKEGKDRLKAQKEANAALKEEQRAYQEWEKEQRRNAEHEKTEVTISSMKEGLNKTLMQIDLDYEKQLDAIEKNEKELIERKRQLKEKEWATLHPNASKEQNPYSKEYAEVNKLLEEADRKYREAETKRAKEQRSLAIANAYKEVLDEVRTFEEQRLKIQEEYARKREEIEKAGGSKPHLDENKRQEDEALAALDAEIAARSEDYQLWMNSINSMTVRGLENMLETTRQVLEDMENMPGVDEKTLAILRAKIATLEQEIKNANLSPAQKDLEVWQKYGSELDKLGGQISTLGDQIGGVVGDGLNAIGGLVSGIFSAIDGVKQYAAVSTQTIEGVSESAAKAIQTIEKASVIITIMTAAMQAVQQVNKFLDDIGLGDKLYSDRGTRIVKEMEAEENARKARLEGLEKAYDQLGEAIEKAYGNSKESLIRAQEENLRQQIAELEQARSEVEDGKNPDEEKVKEYDDQIDQRRGLLRKLHDDAVAAIFGSDIQSAIESLSDALVDTWTKGSSASEAFKNFARQQLKDMLSNYVRDSVNSMGHVEELRKRLKAAQDNDGIITDEEWNTINAYADQSGKEIEEALKPIIDRIRQLNEEEERSAGTKGIAQASQESVNELNGRFTAIQGQIYVIKQDTSNIADSTMRLLVVSNDILGTVRSIDNTTMTMDGRLAAIASDMSYMRRSMSGIESNGLKLKGSR